MKAEMTDLTAKKNTSCVDMLIFPFLKTVLVKKTFFTDGDRVDEYRWGARNRGVSGKAREKLPLTS